MSFMAHASMADQRFPVEKWPIFKGAGGGNQTRCSTFFSNQGLLPMYYKRVILLLFLKKEMTQVY